MVQIDIDTVQHLAELSKIACTPEEEKKFLLELAQIMQHVEQLNEVDTENVEPLFYVLQEACETLFREDHVVETITAKDFFDTVPDHVAHLVKVPKTQK